jgi:hypothetical protein
MVGCWTRSSGAGARWWLLVRLVADRLAWRSRSGTARLRLGDFSSVRSLETSILRLHVAWLAKTHQIVRRVCFLGRSECAEGFTVVNGNGIPEEQAAILARPLVTSNDEQSNPSPVPTPVRLRTTNPVGGVGAGQHLASVLASARNRAVQGAPAVLPNPPRRTLERCAASDAGEQESRLARCWRFGWLAVVGVLARVPAESRLAYAVRRAEERFAAVLAREFHAVAGGVDPARARAVLRPDRFRRSPPVWCVASGADHAYHTWSLPPFGGV